MSWAQKKPVENVSTWVYTFGWRLKMLTSKVFISGNSQAIRLPKEYQVEEKEMYVQKIGRTIILFPKDNPWELFEKSLTEFSEDFMADGRNQPPMQERESL